MKERCATRSVVVAIGVPVRAGLRVLPNRGARLGVPGLGEFLVSLAVKEKESTLRDGWRRISGADGFVPAHGRAIAGNAGQEAAFGAGSIEPWPQESGPVFRQEWADPQAQREDESVKHTVLMDDGQGLASPRSRGLSRFKRRRGLIQTGQNGSRNSRARTSDHKSQRDPQRSMNPT